MNPLFLKTGINRFFALLSVSLICITSFANDSLSFRNFKELCHQSDAYLLYSFTDVSYFKTWSQFRKQTSVQRKLVINNRAGVENYAFVDINQFSRDQLETIRIKTLKSDGTILELDSSLVLKHHSNVNQLGQINYPIPGVEPGDTIELSYSYTKNIMDHEIGSYVNLFSNIPSLNTEYSVYTHPDFLVTYKTYNGFPEPYIVSNDTMLYCVFKMENIIGVPENQYSCIPCELPYLYYSLGDEKNEFRTWKDVYNQEFNFITQPLSLDRQNSSYYKRWKRRILSEARDSSKYYQLDLLLHNINDNFEIEPLREEELIKSSGYFLKSKRFDPISIRRIYRQLLEDLEIDYWAVFARSKRLGNIDPFLIRNEEFDHILFAYEDDKGSLKLLYPHVLTYKYQIGEIPTALFNTEAVIARPVNQKKRKKRDQFIKRDLKMAEVDSIAFEIIKIPGFGASLNNMRQIFYCDVDISNRETTFNSKLSVSGGLSTDIRGFFNLLHQNQEMNDFYEALSEFEGTESSLRIDTIINSELKHISPFVFTISAQGTLINSLTFINDSIVSVTLDKLIHHMQVESDIDSLNLNYYLDYGYSDLFLITLKFPCNIELLGFDNHRWEIKNDYGEYELVLNIANHNQLIIQSTYSINKDMIPKSDYEQLQLLNEFLKEVMNTRLMIKLKV